MSDLERVFGLVGRPLVKPTPADGVEAGQWLHDRWFEPIPITHIEIVYDKQDHLWRIVLISTWHGQSWWRGQNRDDVVRRCLEDVGDE